MGLQAHTHAQFNCANVLSSLHARNEPNFRERRSVNDSWQSCF